MPLKPYDPKTKAAFLKAASDARAAGKTWMEVHAAAKASGYPGTEKGITRMLEKAGPKVKATSEKEASPKPIAKKAAVSKPAVAAKPAKPAPASKPSATAKPAKPVTAPKAAVKATASRPVPGQRYTPAMKSAIMSAAIAARGKGTWADAHKAAKAVGYRGSVQGIVKMLRASNRKKLVRKPIVKLPAAKRGPGRPKGTVVIRGPGRPKGTGKRLGRPPLKAVSVSGLGSIQSAVDRIVRERVSAALDRAIEVLEGVI